MSESPQIVVVSGSFDDLQSCDIRFLQEASRLGAVTVLLWPDETVERVTGAAPKFPLSERLYLVRAIRFVEQVMPLTKNADVNALPNDLPLSAATWVDREETANAARREFCDARAIGYRVVQSRELDGFPLIPATPGAGRKKVVVTGCYDWLHSGHVRFFEEVSAHGDLYVIVGHDANIRLLKGEGHPLLSQEERQYITGAVRYVTHSLVSSGEGWLDADPEIRRLRPDIYAVNEDGDKGGKREYCRQNRIEYLVLKRTPAPGLPKRSSTILRGF